MVGARCPVSPHTRLRQSVGSIAWVHAALFLPTPVWGSLWGALRVLYLFENEKTELKKH